MNIKLSNGYICPQWQWLFDRTYLCRKWNHYSNKMVCSLQFIKNTPTFNRGLMIKLSCTDPKRRIQGSSIFQNDERYVVNWQAAITGWSPHFIEMKLHPMNFIENEFSLNSPWFLLSQEYSMVPRCEWRSFICLRSDICMNGHQFETVFTSFHSFIPWKHCFNCQTWDQIAHNSFRV